MNKLSNEISKQNLHSLDRCDDTDPIDYDDFGYKDTVRSLLLRVRIFQIPFGVTVNNVVCITLL